MVRSRGVLSAAATVAVLQPGVNGATAGHEQKPFGSGQTGDTGSKGENPFTADFNALAEDILDQWNVPGMSIAVVDGEDVFAKVGSVTNLFLLYQVL